MKECRVVSIDITGSRTEDRSCQSLGNGVTIRENLALNRLLNHYISKGYTIQSVTYNPSGAAYDVVITK